MKTMLSKTKQPTEHYREESPKMAVLVTFIAVLIVAAPLTLANKKIGLEGSASADVSNYAQLAEQLSGNITAVQRIIKTGVVQEAALETGTVLSPGMQVITPKIVPTNANEQTVDPNELRIKLSGIFWSEHDPIVTVEGENQYFHTGDVFQGFRILEIRRTEVVFRSPTGETVVKRFYEYLDD